MNGYALKLIDEAERVCDAIDFDIKYYRRLEQLGLFSQEDYEERRVNILSHTSKLDRIWVEYTKCMNDPYHVPRV